jgi:hypothetical protein
MYALSSVENLSLEKSNRRSANSKSPSKARRVRGVILTFHGWDKFQAAKTQAEFDENYGNRFTLEELSDRTTLALHTITKVLRRTEPVDKQSLQYAFRAFGLELSKSDYTHPTSSFEELKTCQENPQQDWGGSSRCVPILWARGGIVPASAVESRRALQISGTAGHWRNWQKYAGSEAGTANSN